MVFGINLILFIKYMLSMMICILRLLKMINKKISLRSDFDTLDKPVILKAMKRRLLTMTITIMTYYDSYYYWNATTIISSISISVSMYCRCYEKRILYMIYDGAIQAHSGNDIISLHQHL